MPTYHVQRSITVNTPLKTLRDSLKNYKEWPKWSPWLIMEPDAAVTYSDRQGQVGATYGWSGVLVGAGSMELMVVYENLLEMEIIFVQPFKSTAKVTFEFEEEDEGTKVTWHMYGSLPFFMFWMKEKMRTFIGMDYERGLLMLKEFVETGSVASYVIIEGTLAMKSQKYVGIANVCSLEDMPRVMKHDFDELFDFMKEKDLSLDRVPFTIYNTFDIFKKETSYLACIPLDEDVETDPSWVKGNTQELNVLKTIHKGRYEHLGNGWMTAMSFARMKKIKVANTPVGLEYYLNNPSDTPAEELVTEIVIPLK
jgi:effector-binding domain-containing protein